KYGIKIVGIPKEEKGIEREKGTTEMRAIKAEVERVKGKKEVRQLKGEVTEELSEEEKVKIEKEEKFILAPLAQKAKPKIVKIENF
ncbi:MAG: hypothetical protein QXY62_01705, partial [Candidatus Altiarchaeota archaeon]